MFCQFLFLIFLHVTLKRVNNKNNISLDDKKYRKKWLRYEKNKIIKEKVETTLLNSVFIDT